MSWKEAEGCLCRHASPTGGWSHAHICGRAGSAFPCSNGRNRLVTGSQAQQTEVTTLVKSSEEMAGAEAAAVVWQISERMFMSCWRGEEYLFCVHDLLSSSGLPCIQKLSELILNHLCRLWWTQRNLYLQYFPYVRSLPLFIISFSFLGGQKEERITAAAGYVFVLKGHL